MSSDKTDVLNGLKVLVIDDSKTIRRTAETLLTLFPEAPAVRQFLQQLHSAAP